MRMRSKRVALRACCPKAAGCMLELGAGAGRNTPRYQGFEQIVLVDYSSHPARSRPASGWANRRTFATSLPISTTCPLSPACLTAPP